MGFKELALYNVSWTRFMQLLKGLPPITVPRLKSQGGYSKYTWRGVRRIFLGWNTRYFFGSRDLSRIFLDLKKYAYFFGSYLWANFSFRVFVAISGSEKYSFELFFSNVCSLFMHFFGLEILMPGIFLGLKFQACVFFWVCNMKLRQTPRHVYFEYPPGAQIQDSALVVTVFPVLL